MSKNILRGGDTSDINVDSGPAPSKALKPVTRVTNVCVFLPPFPPYLVTTGTTERVCLIQGTVEALNGVHNFIAEKVREMPQSAQKPEPVSILQPQTTVNPDRVKQVRSHSVRLCVCVCVVTERRGQVTSRTPCLLVVSLICAPGRDPHSVVGSR